MVNPPNRSGVLALSCALGILLFPIDPVSAVVLRDTLVVAKSGDRSPDDTGGLSELKVPIVQNGGQAAFSGVIREGGFLMGDGIFRGNGLPGNLRLVVRSGQSSPDGNGNIDSINDPVLLINDSDQVAFFKRLANTSGGFSDSGAIFVAGGTPATLKVIVREDQPTPNGTDVFRLLSHPAALNGKGQVAFVAALAKGASGVFRGDGSPGGLVQIVTTGQITPSGDGSFAGPVLFLPVALNESGQVAFISSVIGTAGPAGKGIFLGDGVNPLREIVREGDAAPSGNGTFSSIGPTLGSPSSNTPLNDGGEVAFVAALTGTSGGQSDNAGIFRGDDANLVEVVRRGGLAPDGNGRFLDFSTKIALNNAGQVHVAASLTGATGGGVVGMFIGSGGSVTQIARVNAAAPGGGRFSQFFSVSGLNQKGQALFSAVVDLQNGGPPDDQFGIFFYDGSALYSVARIGDTLTGHGVITSLQHNDGTLAEGSEGSALNDLGQVTYHFTAGGNHGIAIWSNALIFTDGFESGTASAWSSPP